MARGSNLTPDFFGALSWAALWTDWPWETWLKLEIDNAVAAGANVIRIMGTYQARFENTLSLATYLQRWDQLLAYIQSKGVYAYPCAGGDFGTHYAGLLYPTEFVATEATHVAGVCSRYSNVIGLDVVQENAAWAAATSENGRTCVKRIRAYYPHLPLTFSHFANSPADADSVIWRDWLRPLVDFFDIHLYADLTTAFLDGYWAAETKPLLFGEFGANDGGTQASVDAQIARYDASLGLVNYTTAGKTVAGALQWAAADFAPGQRWGMFTETFVPKTWLTSRFANFPVIR